MKRIGVLACFIALVALTSNKPAEQTEAASGYIKYKVLHNGRELQVNPMGLHGHLKHGDKFLGVVVKNGKKK